MRGHQSRSAIQRVTSGGINKHGAITGALAAVGLLGARQDPRLSTEFRVIKPTKAEVAGGEPLGALS